MISKMPKWIGDWLESASGNRYRVISTTELSPNIRQIRFSGDIAKLKLVIGGASVIRVSETEYRNYTIAALDREKGYIEMVIHLHGRGPGSDYIKNLQTGDELYISMPRGHKVYFPDTRQYFFFGDETSLGLACCLQQVLKEKQHRFHFWFELEAGNEQAPGLLGLEQVTVFPKKGLFADADQVRAIPAYNDINWEHTGCVLTGNVKPVQAFRKALKQSGAARISAQGYWLEGKTGL